MYNRDIFDLAKNVKKEADAIEELNMNLKRSHFQQSSGKKQTPSHSVDRVDEGSRENKILKKKIKDLEAKVYNYENELATLKQRYETKSRKVSPRIT